MVHDPLVIGPDAEQLQRAGRLKSLAPLPPKAGRKGYKLLLEPAPSLNPIGYSVWRGFETKLISRGGAFRYLQAGNGDRGAKDLGLVRVALP